MALLDDANLLVNKVLLKLMMVMLLMSQTKYQILLMISLLILDPKLPQA